MIKDITNMYTGKRIKLGASHGSGFIFCGEVTDDFGAILEENTKKYHDLLTKRYEKLVYFSEASLHDTWEKKVDYQISKCIKANWSDEKKIEMRKKYEDRYKTREKFIKFKERRDKSLEMARFRLNYFKPFDQREIEDIFHSKFPGNEDELIIMFDGYEQGDFWTDAECANGGAK